MPKISAKKISEITGFSPATVSNALNNKRGVNRETAEQILDVAKEHGYFGEEKIDFIRFVIFKDSGQVVSYDPFYSALIEGAQSEASASGREMTITNLDKSSEDYITTLNRILDDANSGLLILATEMTEDDAKLFNKAIGPVVMLDNCFDNTIFNTVMHDNTDAMYKAVEHLIIKGHKKIGYIKCDFRIKNFYYRETGYQRALAAYNIPLNPQYIMSFSTKLDEVYRDMCNWLEKTTELPTAFIADNDVYALNAMKAFQKNGYRIPEDISIIGFDDLPMSSLSYPELTTIKVFNKDMGQVAVRRLNEIINYGDNLKTKIQVYNEFIERNSVRSII